MTYTPKTFGPKERMRQYFSDILAEVSEIDDPCEVVDAFLEELDSWAAYHETCKATYESVKVALRKRVSET